MRCKRHITSRGSFSRESSSKFTNEWMNIHQRCPGLLDIPLLAHRHVGVGKEVPAIFLQHGIAG
jgi:hypothetical protein